MNTKTLFLIGITGLSCLPLVAQADIAPDPMSGGISLEAPGSSKTEIALLHNTIKMQVSPNLCKTRAFFRLHNTGKIVDLEVGFPLMYEGEAADFKVFVDNEPVVFKDKTQEDKTPIGQKFIRRWKVWEMKFEADQTYLVEVRYSNTPSAGYSATLDYEEYPFYNHWRDTGFDYDLSDFGYNESISLHDSVKIKTVRYILTTGSYWKGPIERCRVEASIESVATDSIVEVQPPAKSFSPKQLVWEWKNVEPARNVALTFVGGLSPRQTIIPYLEKIAAKNPQDATLQETLIKLRKDFPNDHKINERQKSFIQPNMSKG